MYFYMLLLLRYLLRDFVCLFVCLKQQQQQKTPKIKLQTSMEAILVSVCIDKDKYVNKS